MLETLGLCNKKLVDVFRHLKIFPQGDFGETRFDFLPSPPP